MDQGVLRFRPGTHHRGEETCRRILETAIEIFALDGYDGASTRMLAERAGVNLPAIQYYFGSKEGLYRAAIEHIAQIVDHYMAPAADRVRAALAGGALSPGTLLELLFEMLDAFALLVLGEKPGAGSRKLFIARAAIERMAVLDQLHGQMRGQIVDPCAALVARLIDRPPGDEETLLRAVMILGQIGVFCNDDPRRALGWTEIDDDRRLAIQRLVRQQTAAILRAARETPS